ncbi:hypothetical protein E8E14_001979 [Neopestalotiopsis sp. 37M]|nr:hypothetical protein E8E14_001979 [Neopestalotiopsis sp. 37M]
MAGELPSGMFSKIGETLKGYVAPSEEEQSSTGQRGGLESAGAKTRGNMTTEQHEGGTTVHKSKAPAIQHETVKPMEHQQHATEIDKDIHQDHYHRTVQPVKDKKVMPTKHTYNETEDSRHYDHRDDTAAKQFEQEGAQFRNLREVEGTRRTQESAPARATENIHHHVHETVQPVINRETIQPEVIHTKHNVHETHHLNAQHHATTTAPEIDMASYEGTGTGSAGTAGKKGRGKKGGLGSSYDNELGGNQRGL